MLRSESEYHSHKWSPFFPNIPTELWRDYYTGYIKTCTINTLLNAMSNPYFDMDLPEFSSVYLNLNFRIKRDDSWKFISTFIKLWGERLVGIIHSKMEILVCRISGKALLKAPDTERSNKLINRI